MCALTGDDVLVLAPLLKTSRFHRDLPFCSHSIQMSPSIPSVDCSWKIIEPFMDTHGSMLIRN